MNIGERALSVQPAAQPAIEPTRPSPVPTQYGASPSFESLLADFNRRLSDMEGQLKLKVDGGRVISEIVISREAVKIQGEKIAIVGEATFVDLVRDWSGQATGVIDPSFTQIRGGVIRTEKIVSHDGDSWLDLDAEGTVPFLKCGNTIAIRANGTFTLGGPSGKQLEWDGNNLNIQNNAMIAGTSASTVVSNSYSAISTANAAFSAVSDKIGRFEANVTGSGFALKTSSYDAGTGIGIFNNGIIGKYGGVNKLLIDMSSNQFLWGGDIDSQGTARFRGNITLNGVSTAGVFNDSYGASHAVVGYANGNSNAAVIGINTSSTANVTGAGVLGTTSGQNGAGVRGSANSPLGGFGVYGHAFSGQVGVGVRGGGAAIGVLGEGPTANPSGAGVVAQGGLDGSSPALRVNGRMVMNDASLVANLYAQYGQQINNSGHTYTFSGGAQSGSATANFSGTKPGSSSTQFWLTLVIDGTPCLMPVWPL